MSNIAKCIDAQSDTYTPRLPGKGKQKVLRCYLPGANLVSIELTIGELAKDGISFQFASGHFFCTDAD